MAATVRAKSFYGWQEREMTQGKLEQPKPKAEKQLDYGTLLFSDLL